MDQSKNKISISADLINHNLKETLLSLAKPYLTGYQVHFGEGFLYFSANLSVKTLGELSVHYRLAIEELVFHKSRHTVLVSYQEDVRSNGSLAQSLMLKAVGLKGGTFLQTALEISKVSGFTANQKSCSMDLDQLLDFNRPFLSTLSLQYLDARDDALWLTYSL